MNFTRVILTFIKTRVKIEAMSTQTYTSFEGYRHIATGDLETVLVTTRGVLDRREKDEAAGNNPESPVLIFSHQTGRQEDFDLRGTEDDIRGRIRSDAPANAPAPEPKAGKGRPKLGVVSGEVTLLPEQWEWLGAQSGKASGTIRRLVEEARIRQRKDPKYRAETLGTLLWSLAGNLAGFEEATRHLYRGNLPEFFSITDTWPDDLPRFVRAWLSPEAEADDTADE